MEQRADSLGDAKTANQVLDAALSWHSLEEQRSTLLVTVLEARGLQPRKGAPFCSHYSIIR